jgi:hypothetical protein
MTLSKLRPICFMLLIVTAVSCKKDNSSNVVVGSGGDIVLSVNGGSDIHYDKPTYNLGTETNYKSGVSFARTYYTIAPTSLEQENYITFFLQDENIFQQPLPYQVKKIAVVVDVNIPDKLGVFAYNSSSTYEKGNVNVTVTSAKGTRIKGTYSGVVYNSGHFPPQPDSLRINGSFDVTLPAYYGD